MGPAAPLLFGAHLFSELVTQPISAELKPRGIALAQRAMYLDPLVLPDVGVVIDLLNRQMLDPETANGILRNHGVTIWPTKQGEHGGEYYQSARAAWNRVVDLKKEIPGVSNYVDWLVRGVMDPIPAYRGIIRAGGNPDWWFPHLDRMRERPDMGTVLRAWNTGLAPNVDLQKASLAAGGNLEFWADFAAMLKERPGVSEVLDALIRGRIQPPEAMRLMTEAGSRLDLWDEVIESRYHVPGLVELIELTRRGALPPDQFEDQLQRAGYGDPETRFRFRELLKGLPGVADVTMMGIREAFRPELAAVYNYYWEFPELTRPWYAKLGLDYPTGIQIPVENGVREATLADLYWASHWHPMPMGSAYLAYQRLRPERLDRYRAELPAIKPFTLDDLRLHMRIADLPPGVRDWMVALSHPPLGRRDIQWAMQFGDKDADWAFEQYLDLGFSEPDAQTLAETAKGREEYRQGAWLRSRQQAAKNATISTIESAYSAGIVDYDFAHRQLHDAGIDPATANVIVDTVDFQLKIKIVREAIAATSRDYLSGTLSAGDVEAQLLRMGVTGSRIRDYLSMWSIRRDARRKRLETGKIQAMVAEGLLSAAEARGRLVNLQWSDPDATLLLAEAAGKLQKRLASEEKARESAIQRRARELERLAKDADAQSRKLRAEANRVAPRSVLMKWVKEGEIGEDSFRSMMRERGYPEGDIDLYWQETQRPTPRPPRPAPTARPFPRPEGSAHPGLAVLRKWFNDGVIDSEKVKDGIKGLGYSDSDTESFLRDWGAVPTNGAPGPSSG